MSNRYQKVTGSRKTAPQTMEIYDWIRAEVVAGRPFPTVSQIAERQGWGHSSANDTLARLVRKGYLKVVQRKRIGSNGWRYTYELRENVEPES
jgi:Mn-dependent DtxR family transcriptional regulator